MVAFFVVITIVAFLIVDGLVQKKLVKGGLGEDYVNQTIFYNQEIGFTMADGGEDLKGKEN